MRWVCLIFVLMFGSHAFAQWTYDPSDTFVKFFVHLKTLPKFPNSEYHQHLQASGTRFGKYIITNAHAVCLPGKRLDTVWLSFPTRYAYLEHFNADLDVGQRVVKMSDALSMDATTYQKIDPLFDALEKHAIAYKVYLPDGTECDGDSDRDIAILERVDHQHPFKFKTPSIVQKIDCRLPKKQTVSWLLGGGERLDQVDPPVMTQYRTSLGTFVVRDPAYNEGTLFGIISPMYQGVQMNMPDQHTFLTTYTRVMAVGDSGSAMIQAPCEDNKDVNACMDKVFQRILLPIEEACPFSGHDSCGLLDFLEVNGYDQILNPQTAMFGMRFWGIAQGNGRLTVSSPETSDFAVSFAQNRDFIRKHLPPSWLDASCMRE